MKNHLRRVRIKLLVDQATNQIVWLTMNGNEIYPPIIDPSLTGVNFASFTELTDGEIWDNFNNYRLFLNKGFTVEEAPDKNSAEHKRIRLLRFKAFAVEIINGSVDFRYQTLGYTNTTMYEQFRKPEGSMWVNFFQTEYNCNEQQALDLIKFKLEEYDTAVYKLESTRISSTNRIIKATSEDEVQEALDLFGIILLTKNITILKDLRSIRGY